jgi:hypothetical protein
MKTENFDLKRGLGTLGVLWAVLLIATGFVAFSDPVKNALALGVTLACANGALAFLSLAWAFPKSQKIFFGAFFGNMVWKLAVLFSSAAIFMHSPNMHIQTLLLSMAGLTFLINVLEIKLLPSTAGVK